VYGPHTDKLKTILALSRTTLACDYARFGRKARHRFCAERRHGLSTTQAQLRHNLGTQKIVTHTLCTTRAHFVHELIVSRHASESIFRSSTRCEELLCYKNTV